MTEAKQEAVRQATTATLQHLLDTRGSVSPEMKDLIRTELASREAIRQASACPYCGYSQTDLATHVDTIHNVGDGR